jgi:hypothetical protein
MVILEYHLFNAWFMLAFLIPTLSMMILCLCSFHVFFVIVPLYVFVASPNVYEFYFPVLTLSCSCTPCTWRWISTWRADLLLGPPSLLFNGYWPSFPVVKLSWLDVIHWPPSNADVKNEWSCTSFPCIRLSGPEQGRLYLLPVLPLPCVRQLAFKGICTLTGLYTAVCSSQLNTTFRRFIMV